MRFPIVISDVRLAPAEENRQREPTAGPFWPECRTPLKQNAETPLKEIFFKRGNKF